MQNKLMHSINGKITGEDKLLISGRDLGLLRAFAVFDFLVTYKNRPFMLDAHIQRLLDSASAINLHTPWTKEKIKEMIYETIQANNKEFEKSVKIILTGGVSTDGFTPQRKTNIIVLIDKLEKLDDKVYKKGVIVITNKFQRYLPAIKTTFYTEAVRNSDLLQKKDAFEILYFDENQVYECSRSNIFALIDGILITPKNNILPGITRKVVLEMLRLSCPVMEKDFTLTNLLKAQEIFITKSNDEIVPVIQIDDKTVGSGVVGNTTEEVMRKFKEFVNSEDWYNE